MIAGLDLPDSGRGAGQRPARHGPGADRGMVFQKYTSFAWLTVAQNIEYGLKHQGRPASRAAQTWSSHLIEAVGLNGL